ncbi:hypothetical protein Veis_0749 [Verminephrobacter eiseniae EF01-2]|uniref:Uncharacterized protein n=1 Tax=Verminephrobacter eiseniae (strain EF01-2) TaxID=391735 RepID=A1WFX4_VEREI|nr:hypothetical protein Veis_0749 [Verminephrobacter eiseniae EF01-2]
MSAPVRPCRAGSQWPAGAVAPTAPGAMCMESPMSFLSFFVSRRAKAHARAHSHDPEPLAGQQGARRSGHRAGHAGLAACQVFGPFGLARPLAVPLGRRHRGVAQPSFFRPGERNGRDGPTEHPRRFSSCNP